MLLETRTSQSISWTLTWSRIIERISSARGIPRKTKLKICVQRIVTEPAIPWQVGRILNSYSLHIGHLPMPCSFIYIALEQLLMLAESRFGWALLARTHANNGELIWGWIRPQERPFIQFEKLEIFQIHKNFISKQKWWRAHPPSH